MTNYIIVMLENIFTSNDQNFTRDLSLIFILSFLSYVSDICKNNQTLYAKCENKLIFNAVLLFHHFIWTFALFGFLSNNNQLLRLYVAVLIIYLAHWKANNNQCFITQWVRKTCKLDDSHTLQYFVDTLFNNKVLQSRNSQKIFLFTSLITATLKINNKE